MDLTREQREAVEADNPTLLVSAAAGSGKTAVLVERVIRLVEDGARLNRMLIVTFTRAAAAELRERIYLRLQTGAAGGDERYVQALTDLEATEIATIHSFCQKLLKEEFQALGLDPRQRVLREDEGTLWKAQAGRDALNALLEAKDPEVAQLVTDFGAKTVLAMADSLHKKLMALSHPFDWLETMIRRAETEDMGQHPWYQALYQEGLRMLAEVPPLWEAYRAETEAPDHCEADRKTCARDAEVLGPFLARMAAGDPAGALPLLPGKLPSAVSARGLDEEAAFIHDTRWVPLRDQLRKTLSDVRKFLDSLNPDPEQSRRDLARVVSGLRGLKRVTEEMHRRYLELKREKGRIDFADMEQFAYDLLTDPAHPEIREKYAAAFDHIFIDECQDNAQIQNDILMALHGPENHLFMVGDVKQSIYRFRMANPTLFLERVRSYSRDAAAAERAIFLQRNFRSLSPVLSATNAVFSRVMTAEETELDYLPEDHLVPGREGAGAPVEVHLFPAAEKSAENLRLQALAAADRIRGLLQTPRPDGRGNYRFRDICILMRETSTSGKVVSDILQEAGIPVFYEDKSYYATPEVRQALALLRAVCDPADEMSLLAVLRHEPFRFTDADLAAIRCREPRREAGFGQALAVCAAEDTPLGARCRRCLDTLAEWRFRRESMRLFDYLWWLLRESGLYAVMGTRKDARLRQANLRLLCQRGAEYEEKGGTSLQGFLDSVAEQVSVGDTESAKPLGENEDLVRIMTIHKSKGLQFPVVLCLNLQKGTEKKGQSGDGDKCAFHRTLGVALPCQNRAAGTRRKSLGSRAIALARSLDERAEQCRLLYVAMTRAADRLILMGSGDPDNPVWHEAPGPLRVRHADSMLDWVMPVVLDLEAEGGESPFALTIHDDPAAEAAAAEAEAAQPPVLPGAQPHTRLSWWDEAETPAPQPLKTSVTSLTRKQVLSDPLPLTDAEEDMAEKRQGEVILSPLRLGEIPPVPGFLRAEQPGAADRGSATHRFLSLVPLETLAGQPPEALLPLTRDRLRAMAEAGILSPAEAALIRPEGCAAFFRSDLGRRFLAAEKRRREWRFNLALGPGGETLLQGVIDAAFREAEGWVLIDYKTDIIQDEGAFVERHQAQLNWYAEAVRRITGEPVRALFLYALRYGRAVPVEIRPPQAR